MELTFIQQGLEAGQRLLRKPPPVLAEAIWLVHKIQL